MTKTAAARGKGGRRTALGGELDSSVLSTTTTQRPTLAQRREERSRIGGKTQRKSKRPPLSLDSALAHNIMSLFSQRCFLSAESPCTGAAALSLSLSLFPPHTPHTRHHVTSQHSYRCIASPMASHRPQVAHISRLTPKTSAEASPPVAACAVWPCIKSGRRRRHQSATIIAPHTKED